MHRYDNTRQPIAPLTDAQFEAILAAGKAFRAQNIVRSVKPLTIYERLGLEPCGQSLVTGRKDYLGLTEII